MSAVSASAQPLRGVNPETLASSAANTAQTYPFWAFRARFRHWLEVRLPFSDSIQLTQKNVYILPTRPGLMLALTLLVLLIASINYQLNLGYLLTFLLAGTALVGMHVCHGTLRGLALSVTPPPAQHAGATATVSITLTNTGKSIRHGIGLSLLNPALAEGETSGDQHWSWTDVPAQGASVVQIAFTPPRRGLHRLPTLTAETRFPLGTFRVWTVWRPAAQVLVYPAPELNPPPLPQGEPRAQGASAATRIHTSGEFDGVRAYRRGDPLKNVLWKKAAKADEQGNGLLVRDTQQAQRHELWLDIRQAGPLGLEQKLSRLCAWVLQAEKLGLDYGLRLHALNIAPGSGEAHKRHCLEALATC